MLNRQVAGIDIGSTEHWVCGPVNEKTPYVRVFGTTTPDLNEIADWLAAQGVTSVAMESTSVYWIPLFEILEERGLDVVLVNARQLHHVPGRKTDFHDCQWIQQLHSCGLLRGSFRPGDTVSRLRSMHRHSLNLIEERTRCLQWMQKALDQMNVQVHRAVTDITGVTGMAIVRAIVAGEREPAKLAQLRDPRCHKSAEEIARHLTGNWRDDHLFNLRSALRLYDVLQEQIAEYEAKIRKALESLQPEERAHQVPGPHPNPTKERAMKTRGEQELRVGLWRFSGVDLTRIDGISAGSAQAILTEIGLRADSFPNEHHFVSWLRLCPRIPISGGKLLKKRRNGLGANRISCVLRMAATSLQRSKTALGAAFRRKARLTSFTVAVFETARRLATLVYRMLRYGQDYVDAGEAKYEERFRARRISALTKTAKSLGFTIAPHAEPA